MRVLLLAMVGCLLCASEANACSADLDNNGKVEISDFLILVDQFGQTCPSEAACSADLDNNGKVEISDFLILVDQFGQTCPSIEAGYGRIVLPGTRVDLNATLTHGTGASIEWRQVQGTMAAISSTNALQTTVSVPTVSRTETLLFEVRAEMASGQQVSDRVWIEVYVHAHDPADLTLVADYSQKPGWECVHDPVAVPDVQKRELETTIEYTTNGIPAHATGMFPNGSGRRPPPYDGNPNMIGEVTQTWRIPRYPVKTNTPTEMATFGITLEGIKLERDTAERHPEGRWSYEALTPGRDARFEWLGTDCNNAHVQPTGIYHYHGIPHSLVNEKTSGTESAEMVLVGYAADGFPIYVASGPNAPEGSWELRPGMRESGPGGRYDGTFREDWRFVAGSGDLDRCNGRFGMTPEHPEGIYHYYLTEDYPYISRCVWGTPDPSFRQRRRPPGGGQPPGGG